MHLVENATMHAYTCKEQKFGLSKKTKLEDEQADRTYRDHMCYLPANLWM